MNVARRFVVYLVVAVLYAVAGRILEPDDDTLLAPLVYLWVPLFTIVVVALVETALWWRGRDES